MLELQPVVIDTNVLLAASKLSDATEECVLACTNRLIEVREGGKIVIDSKWEILTEYNRQLEPHGSRPGDIFLKWVLFNRYNSQVCDQIDITPLPDGTSYVEFPIDNRLEKFDLSDRKFVAVALAHPNKPDILNATDSDWISVALTLLEYGVSVRFLCPELLA
jgi:hypothetical protein